MPPTVDLSYGAASSIEKVVEAQKQSLQLERQ